MGSNLLWQLAWRKLPENWGGGTGVLRDRWRSAVAGWAGCAGLGEVRAGGARGGAAMGTWQGRAVGWGSGDGRRVAGSPQLWRRSGPA